MSKGLRVVGALGVALALMVTGYAVGWGAMPALASGEGFDCAMVSEIPQGECAALVALYTSTGGPEWQHNDGWLESNTPCDWLFVECTNNHVTRLILQNNWLEGSLPPEIGDLTGLTELAFTNNDLRGPLPATLGNLTHLQLLLVSRNPKLDGPIPPELGNLDALHTLNLELNSLSGPIPAELGGMDSVRILILYANNLSGTIPPQLSNLPNASC